MKIAIPTMGSKGQEESVAKHFGRCPTYTILDDNGKVIEIIENTSSHMGGQGLPPELLKQHDVTVLLCQEIGLQAVHLCQKLQIDVYIDSGITVKDLYNNWKSSPQKVSLDKVCQEHLS